MQRRLKRNDVDNHLEIVNRVTSIAKNVIMKVLMRVKILKSRKTIKEKTLEFINK
jgi:hypothetical protein